MRNIHTLAFVDELGFYIQDRNPWVSDSKLMLDRLLDGRKVDAIIGGKHTVEALPSILAVTSQIIMCSRTSHHNQWVVGYLIKDSLASALELCEEENLEEIYIIGGVELLIEAIDNYSPVIMEEVRIDGTQSP